MVVGVVASLVQVVVNRRHVVGVVVVLECRWGKGELGIVAVVIVEVVWVVRRRVTAVVSF